FILGALGHIGSWGWAFILAGLVMLFGLLLFLRKRELFMHLHLEHQKTDFAKERYPLKKQEKERILVILVLSFVSLFFWVAYNQAWSSMSIFALRFTDRMVGHFELRDSWLLSCEIICLIIF